MILKKIINVLAKKIKRFSRLIFLLNLTTFFLLIYTRLIKIDWGLPFPMHPDERNMSLALSRFNCHNGGRLPNCLDPDFFAYGQLPLYVGYLIVLFKKFIFDDFTSAITFTEATIALRLISAFSSVGNFFIIYQIIKLLSKKNLRFSQTYIISLILIFQPYAIQFSHFGTTESLLTLGYSIIVWLSIKVLKERKLATNWFICSFILGLTLATKISAFFFFFTPILTLLLISLSKKNSLFKIFTNHFRVFFGFIFITSLTALAFSFYSFLALDRFFNSLFYEKIIATGELPVFYTRQFEKSIPIIFPLVKIFPYALGPFFWLSVIGFLLLSWRNRFFNLIRFAILSYFISQAFLYTKWTRFYAPIFPLIIIFGIMFFLKIDSILIKKIKKIPYLFLSFFIVVFFTINGAAYLNVYHEKDVRIRASEWFVNNFTTPLTILSETANVVDIPFLVDDSSTRGYRYYSFNFYDLDINPQLVSDLDQILSQSDIIIVPSRRIWMNHVCFDEKKFLIERQTFSCKYLKEKYPLLNRYYSDLFHRKLPFKEIATFESFPKIRIFNTNLFVLNDENAEETWTVFDHPVIRIYQRIREQ